jgi:hypothetical protein
MYKLKPIYGQRAHDAWVRERPQDLRPYREDAPRTASGTWKVRTYSDLVDAVSFVSVMNKRLDIAFRGQSQDWGPVVPAIFRATWSPPRWALMDSVNIADRGFCAARLGELGPLVYKLCEKRGLPRWRALQNVSEAQWSVIQHYGLWPTPLIDVTRSLRVAASFALRARNEDDPEDTNEISGLLYVVGLPNRTGSISYSLDDQVLVANLNAVCPPAARRPHLQEGLLVGRFPTHDPDAAGSGQSDLRRRVLARFQLLDAAGPNGFWSCDFPRLSDAALLPSETEDPLLGDFARAISYRYHGSGVDWEPA